MVNANGQMKHWNKQWMLLKEELVLYKGLTYHGTYLQELPLQSSEWSDQIQKNETRRNATRKKKIQQSLLGH